ncbi:MAG: SUMF1/EgtB/PvdO family nonheme iron enzyme [Pontiella sp.]
MLRIRNNFTSKILFTLFALYINADAVITLSNVRISQREGAKLVDIYFDVDNSTDSSASVFVIISNGASQVTSPTLSGNVGSSIFEGTSLHVIWNGGTDLNGIISSNLTVTLQVSDPIASGMVPIPAGTNSGNDPDFGSYNLTVDAFLMDSTEITKPLWDLVANSTIDVSASSGAAKASDHPVQDITWYECARWCNARSTVEGLTPCYNTISWSCNFSANGYRLPTDEEWEYAARGGVQNQRFPWGHGSTHDDVNYFSSLNEPYDDNDEVGHHPVYDSGGTPYTSPERSFAPNGYGLYDMNGNVWEWWWNTIGSGKSRRGGSWDNEAYYIRTGYKDNTLNAASPGVDNMYIGFRTVRNAPAPEAQTKIIVFDSRDYSLSVASAYGLPVPEVGNSVYAWKSTVACSVEAMVNGGGTNYTCIGWAGTGNVPVSGNSNSVMVVLSNLTSSIIWNWVSDDADSDGMLDVWELAYFLGLEQTATNDFDFDGQDNLSEYIAGTDPTNAASLFALTENIIPGGFILGWPATTNRTYNVYWTPNLLYVEFQPLKTNIVFPHNSATTTTSAAGSFFRVDVVKP